MESAPKDPFAHQLSKSFWALGGLLLLAVGLLITLLWLRLPVSRPQGTNRQLAALPDTNFTNLWAAPADWRLHRLPPDEQQLVRYGRELIAHTANYLGPRGSVAQLSNGMNCQNCHLKAGTQPWGNNYSAVRANYPKYRERSGTVENVVKRVNDCFQRSLNGRPLDSTSREMGAILAYIRWLGTDVPPRKMPRGVGLFKLKGLSRPADPARGLTVYTQQCAQCHQAKGEGVLAADGRSYVYPPLWGPHSYNVGAGLFRLSNLAGYVRFNMPFGVTYETPQLSEEEAWDVAAYVNSRPRPAMDLSRDWPNVAGKPFDHPFGPYADPFSEEQHKYGPFKPIKAWKEAHKTPAR